MAALSEHEKRQFHLIEQRLKVDDPKFVKSMRLASMWHRPKAFLYRPGSRNLLFGIVGVVLGSVIFGVGNTFLSNPAAAISIGIAGIIIGGFGFYNVLTVSLLNNRISQPRVKLQKTFMANLESRLMASFQSRWDARKKDGW